jgi:ribosome maturation factor RimP
LKRKIIVEEEFRKNLGNRAIVSFGSKDDRAEGKVVRVENSYVVLGGSPNALYVPYQNIAFVQFAKAGAEA